MLSLPLSTFPHYKSLQICYCHSFSGYFQSPNWPPGRSKLCVFVQHVGFQDRRGGLLLGLHCLLLSPRPGSRRGPHRHTRPSHTHHPDRLASSSLSPTAGHRSSASGDNSPAGNATSGQRPAPCHPATGNTSPCHPATSFTSPCHSAAGVSSPGDSTPRYPSPGDSAPCSTGFPSGSGSSSGSRDEGEVSGGGSVPSGRQPPVPDHRGSFPELGPCLSWPRRHRYERSREDMVHSDNGRDLLHHRNRLHLEIYPNSALSSLL